ncbi:hypothetical protein, partial [Escherichia coli]|uniref:hypothetical protein n=1 Tax=Escherichia coli TaxID=562 RepID=UPI00193AE6C7
MGSCAAPSAKGDDKFITTDYLQQCLAQFIDAGLLLGQQRRALDGRRGSGDAAIERAFPAQMGDMGGA